MTVDIALLLAGLALILALIDQFRAQGRSLTAWAVVALALIPLLALVSLK